jgi:meso-butanediol dehydrogenase/(S,S)-butanediol dehydrogenase/diacetyl reductase
MVDRLKDKVAIVTGAAGNVGGATARLFAQEGATVICTDLGDMAPINQVERRGGKQMLH